MILLLRSNSLNSATAAHTAHLYSKKHDYNALERGALKSNNKGAKDKSVGSGQKRLEIRDIGSSI